VRRYHGGDWEAFGRAAILGRTTLAGWKEGRGTRVPDVVQLVQLGERLDISLDWLLLGRGEPLRDDAARGDTAVERFRSALAAYLATSGNEVEIWVRGRPEPVHRGHPTAEQYVRVLPEAETVFTLAAELIRPLLLEALRVVIDREWRRGRWAERFEARGLPDGRTVDELQTEEDAESEAKLEEYRVDLVTLA
jgi:hypothetical protein